MQDAGYCTCKQNHGSNQRDDSTLDDTLLAKKKKKERKISILLRNLLRLSVELECVSIK